MIARIANVLVTGGRFLFTSGDENGSIEGAPMNGVPFRYWSFDEAGYRTLLAEHGLELVETHRDAGHNVHYSARKLTT